MDPKLKTPGAGRCSSGRGGFTLVELLVVIAIIGMLAGMILPALARARENAKASQCQSKLMLLGVAEAMYSSDNRDKLTFAAMRGLNTGGEWTYDDLLADYIGAALTEADKRANQSPEAKVGLLLRCPADRAPLADWVTEGTRRSYSMIGHDMSTKGKSNFARWRATPNDRTGAGLYWAHSIRGPVSETFYTNDTVPPHRQSYVLSSYMMDPQSTLEFTEQINIANIAGHHSGAKIDNAAEHHVIGTRSGVKDFTFQDLPSYTYDDPKEHHKGGYNYLFADGHVEHLLPRETLGEMNNDLSKQSGMWTMDPRD